MGLSIKNVLIGILVFAFMSVALFSFSESWIGEFDKEYSPQMQSIHSEINVSLNAMYDEGKLNSKTVEESSIYAGNSDLGLFTAEPFKVLKNSISLTKMGLNMTTQVSRLGIIPDWFFTMAIAAFLLTLTYLVMNAIFKRDV